MQDLAQPGMFSRGIVSDFIFAKDALFARMNLDDEEYRLYAQIHAQMEQGLPKPDLIVWLQAEPGTLIERIRRRGIAMEQTMSEAYLTRLCDAYVEHFRSNEGAPVLTVVTEDFNPVDRPEDFERLMDRLANFEGQRGVLDFSRADLSPEAKSG
jgi:deoxyadenosine/deoxycytidine kinase